MATLKPHPKPGKGNCEWCRDANSFGALLVGPMMMDLCPRCTGWWKRLGELPPKAIELKWRKAMGKLGRYVPGNGDLR